MKRIIGIGWDVGGWLGKKHGIATAEYSGDKIKWVLKPSATGLPESGFVPRDFYPDFDNHDDTVIVTAGIDAALAYPAAFRRLVSGQDAKIEKPGAEIDNLFAYRDTERHIYQMFQKKPLSATFDKLGNNTSLAIMTARKWCREYNFCLQPANKAGEHHTSHHLIEVYPSLIKSKGFAPIYSQLIKHIPPEVKVNSDAFDAALCALLAVSYGLSGESTLLPALVFPPDDWNNENGEGWIYYPQQKNTAQANEITVC